jgi:hypothetical protein
LALRLNLSTNRFVPLDDGRAFECREANATQCPHRTLGGHKVGVFGSAGSLCVSSLLSLSQTTERHAQGKGLLGARALGRTGKPLFQTAFPLNTCFGRQSGALDDKFAEMFKSQLINTKRAVTAVSVGLIVVGVLALVIAVYLVFKNMNQNQ